MSPTPAERRRRVWLFDLDDTLHHASNGLFAELSQAMTDYIVRHLGLDEAQAHELRQRYWRLYGATLLGLVRHHGVQAAHFLAETHALPRLEQQVRGSRADLLALRRLPGRKVLLTNAPRRYALRVLEVLGVRSCFEQVLAVEQMRMFGQLRPKPDRRMFRHVAARLKTHPARCTLVEDSLEHQKAARSLGMDTVWMQGWLRKASAAKQGHPGRRPLMLGRKPGYVGRRLRQLRSLR